MNNIINDMNRCPIFVRAGLPSCFPNADIKGEGTSPLQK